MSVIKGYIKAGDLDIEYLKTQLVNTREAMIDIVNDYTPIFIKKLKTFERVNSEELADALSIPFNTIAQSDIEVLNNAKNKKEIGRGFNIDIDDINDENSLRRCCQYGMNVKQYATLRIRSKEIYDLTKKKLKTMSGFDKLQDSFKRLIYIKQGLESIVKSYDSEIYCGAKYIDYPIYAYMICVAHPESNITDLDLAFYVTYDTSILIK